MSADEHVAHVLGVDGVTPVRFDVETHPDGSRTLTNTDQFDMGPNDVLDIPIAGGVFRLIGTGDRVISLELHDEP